MYSELLMTEYTPEERERILQEMYDRAGKIAKEQSDADRAEWEAKRRNAALDKARDEYILKRDRIVWQTTVDEKVRCTEFGNAIRFMKHYGQSCLYCSTQDSWYLWNGEGYWKKDSLLLIEHMIREVLQNIYGEAQIVTDSDRRSTLAKWAIQCEHPQHIIACMKHLRSLPSLSCKADKFDNDKFLFNMTNGTYDLTNHTFLQHDRLNFITRQVSYAYDADAKCPAFLSFLNRIFRGRKDKADLIRYLQKAVGYTLTGDTAKQVIFLLHGSGANGKSTLIETLRKLYGEYGTTVAANALTTKKNDSVRNDIARLVNIRFVSTSENAMGTILDEELIKNLTGGDQVAARFLFEEEFLFFPHLKLWWAFNHPPNIRDMTHSLWRRLKMIPFDEVIPEREQIPQTEILMAFEKELPGVFNWAIEGLKLFQKEGLHDVAAVSEAVKEFKEDQDILIDFISTCCDVKQEFGLSGLIVDKTERAARLYQNYREWCMQTSGDRVISQKKFSQLLVDRGFKKTRDMAGVIFHGITIKKF